MLRSLLFGATALAASAAALDPIVVKNQEFINNSTGKRFDIVGVDYQPGGQSGYNANSGQDPLTDETTCLRDAALMQMLGVNTIRVYNLNSTGKHDMCASIFNSVGIYMLIDVNTPDLSIHQVDPGSSYTSGYLSEVFGMIEAFRNYPNTLGFFSANELINNDQSSGADPPYIRAVTRDMKQYIQARGGRQIPVGYSAAQVQNILVDTSNYIQCAINGDASDMSRSDFFGLNDYQWCGQNTFQGSGYETLVGWYSNTSIPVFFSEYGCNKVLPRTFQEVGTIYSQEMSILSGGLVYQWTQDTSNYGLVNINDNNTLSLLSDFNALKSQLSKIDQNVITSTNQSATAVKPPTCGASLISGTAFNNSFNIPPAPSGASSMIKNGIQNPNKGSVVSVTATSVSMTVYQTNGAPLQNLAISMIPGANVPGATGSSGGSSSSSTKNASPSVRPGEMGAALSALVFVLGLLGLY